MASPSVVGEVARMTSSTSALRRVRRFGDAELLRTDAADGRERAVEDVIDAVEAAGFFNGGDVVGSSMSR